MVFNIGSVDLTKEEIEKLKKEADRGLRSVRNLASLIIKKHLSDKDSDQ